MIGLLQIMIYLFCVYLVYKGYEIFQIAFVAPSGKSRNIGVVVGGIMVGLAIFIGLAAVSVTGDMVRSIGENMPRIK